MNNKTTSMRRFLFAAFIALAAASAFIPGRLFAAEAIDSLLSRASFAGLTYDLPETIPVARAEETFPLGVFDVPTDKIYYVLPTQVDLSQVPPAPAAGSAVDKEDLAAVLRWQAVRTDAQCAAANAQADATYDEFFGEVSPFGNPAPKEVENIFQKVRTDAGSIVYLQKEQYKRPRPFLRDPAITPCLARESGYSYPSGHSTTARVFGLMLSDLVPANAAKFMSYADQGALNRVIGGVHHPSDVEAGKTLGDAIYKALKQNRTFNTDMDTLRRDLKP
jgi:acid phosphatase (class A)